MDALARDPRLRAFRATDAYALEVYRVARTLRVSDHADLVDEMRRSAVRSGGAVVAASASTPGGDDERRLLERARRVLIESRYYIYLARRIGLLDMKLYRGLTGRQDIALRELDGLLTPGRVSPRPPPI